MAFPELVLFHKKREAMKQLLPALCALQLFAYTVAAQEQNMNVNAILNNEQFRNVRNINVSVPTGPNGPNGNVYEVNINVSGNRLRPNVGGPNVQGFTSSVIPKQTTNRQVVNRPKTTAADNKPKPSPAVASAATRRPQSRPNSVAAPQTRRRTVRPAVQAVATPVITAPAVQVQEAAPVAVNIPVVQADNNIPVQQVMNNDMVVQTAVTAPAVNAFSMPAMRRTVSSGGSGSSLGVRRSKSKKHGSFGYQANKKLKKLFAHNRKGKFDPAKCFVWN